MPQTLRSLRRQLVRQLRPLAFEHGPHFIRDMVDVLDVQHVFVESLQIGWHHHLVADNAELIDAPFLAH